MFYGSVQLTLWEWFQAEYSYLYHSLPSLERASPRGCLDDPGLLQRDTECDATVCYCFPWEKVVPSTLSKKQFLNPPTIGIIDCSKIILQSCQSKNWCVSKGDRLPPVEKWERRNHFHTHNELCLHTLLTSFQIMLYINSFSFGLRYMQYLAN